MGHSTPNSGDGAVAQMEGRPVLQPAGNRVAAAPSPTKHLKKSLSLPASFDSVTTTSGNANVKDAATAVAPPRPRAPEPEAKKKAKKPTHGGQVLPMSTALFPEPLEPGSIAAAQREHAALMHARRKSKIAHYGRAASFSRVEGKVASSPAPPAAAEDERRCSFITPYSDPVYVAYHDQEWGVPVHDEKLLFELLTMSGVQVGSDWTSILRRRSDFRKAFAGFDVDAVSKFTEKQMAAVGAECGLDLATVRGVVDNADRIIEVRSLFGSLDKYVWGFVNRRPLSPAYKYARKMPVKTSKSESISKDMVRRGFRLVGPTVLHSFMQAAGLTNDHLVSCPRHRFCAAAADAA